MDAGYREEFNCKVHDCEAAPTLDERTKSSYPRKSESVFNSNRLDDETDSPPENIISQHLECTEDEEVAHQPDQIGDAAAIFVWLYLLFISTLLVGALILGTFVVLKFGFVIFVAVLLAVFALAVVGATLMSVITGDAKLTKARSTVDAWHVVVKEAILEEIQNFHKDLSAFSDGTLLLTYGGPDEISNKINDSDIEDQQYTKEKAATNRKPKSLIFKYVVSPFTKLGKKEQRSSGNSGKKSRSWMRKKKGKEVDTNSGSPSGYVPPVV
jgi:ABC-type multidrug transport system fused ATPase/permease subunit